MDSSNDGKTELVRYLQRLLGRALTKRDVTYRTTAENDGFASNLVLESLELDAEFYGAGETEKASEESAAHAAVEYLKWHRPLLAQNDNTQTRTSLVHDDGRCVHDFKTDLVRALQAHFKRALTKADLTWNSVADGGMYRATVTLNCLRYLHFTGELRTSSKLAEHSAAEQALTARPNWPTPLPLQSTSEGTGNNPRAVVPTQHSGPKGAGKSHMATPVAVAPMLHPTAKAAGKAKSPSKAAGKGQPKGQSANETRVTNKSDKPAGVAASRIGDFKTELVKSLQRRISRTLTKEDLIWSTWSSTSSLDDGLFEGSVKLICLQGEEFTGSPSPTMKAAEHSAAEQALNSLDMLGTKQTVPLATQAVDPKSALVKLLQKVIGRPLVKPDPVFEHVEIDGLTQATVTLVCLNGEKYIGEPVVGQKAAERKAAQQALMAHGEIVGADSAATHGKRKAPGNVEKENANPKTALVQFLQRVYGRALVKTDIKWETVSVEDKHITSVTLVCHGGAEFIGEPCPTPKMAEQSAAQVALAHHEEEIAALPPQIPREEKRRRKEPKIQGQ